MYIALYPFAKIHKFRNFEYLSRITIARKITAKHFEQKELRIVNHHIIMWYTHTLMPKYVNTGTYFFSSMAFFIKTKF